jgi:hypothetical protein
MPQENVELMGRGYADPRRLTVAASEWLAHETEFEFSAVYPDRSIMRGVEEVRRFRETGPCAVTRSIRAGAISST